MSVKIVSQKKKISVCLVYWKLFAMKSTMTSMIVNMMFYWKTTKMDNIAELKEEYF